MDLQRFRSAHEYDYQMALEEIKNGKKRSCWMWYIFPQIAGLGKSSTAQYYAISDLEEAKAFLADGMLGAHLREISQVLLELPSNDAYAVMGCPDNMKLKSSMTLFAIADPKQEVFQKVLDKFFNGKKDVNTIKLLGQA